MPRAANIRERVIDTLSRERRWMTLREVADHAKTTQKAARAVLAAALSEFMVFQEMVGDRGVYCIGMIPPPKLDPAAIPPKATVPPPRAWTLDFVRSRCDIVGDCWIWKQGVQSKGYPQASINGKSGQSVRTYVFTKLLGRTGPRNRRFCLVTKCGDRRCVSPECLVVRQRSSIMREQWEAGERHPHLPPNGFINRKLTDAQVDEIRALPEDFNRTHLARDLGVCTKTIQKARAGQTFKPRPAASVFDWRP